ncbi:MAG: YDG domain-containing protein, partial [Steroidobacteraceae bacterium]
TGTFATQNVGTGIGVTTAMTLGGTDAGNYTLIQPTGLTANITPYVLSLTGTRVYDANTDAGASLFGSSGVLTGADGETLTLSGTGTLSSKDVNATQGFASLSGFTLTGNGSALASNYTLSGGTDWVDITPATLTVAGTTAAGKVYDGTTVASLSGATLAGVLGSDNVTLGNDTTGTFATQNAGTGIGVSTAMTLGGTDAGNYTLTQPTAITANITPYVLSLTGTRVYDANTDAAASLFGSSGVLTGADGQTLTLSGTGTLSSKNVGTEGFGSLSGFTLTGNGSALASNYTLAGGTDSVDITPLAVTVTASGANKVYDRTTSDPGLTLASSGVLTGDVVNFSDSSATFASKNVGTGITITVDGITASGTDAGNYTLINTTATTAANITAKPITVTATGTNIVYNAGLNDSVTLASSGIVAGDTVTFADSSATFADPNVGTGKTVTVSGITDGGASAGNYTLSNTTATTTANITPYVLSLTGTRVYDANTDAAASLFGSSGVLTGVDGQTLTLSGTGTLNSKDVDATQGFASLLGFTLTGNGSALATNYTLTGGTDWVDITPATLTVAGTTAAGKVYDGTTVASLSGATLVGVLGTDTVTLGHDTTGTFATQNVGTGIGVTTAMTLGGTDAGNYTLIQPTGLTANIT